MTVGELRRILEELDSSLTIVLQKDAEGNSYSPLADTWTGHYVPLSTWSGEAYDSQEEAQDDTGDDGVSALVLVPVN
jgi:hypothetical protein